jgi:N-acylneuraminate cytidylyltransferase
MFDRIVVSTDDNEVARVALEAGAEVPFRRSPELSDDHTATVPVIADAITRLEADGQQIPDPIVAVYPAAVLTTAVDFMKGLEIFHTTQAQMVFAGSRFPAPIQRAWRRGEDGRCEMIWPEHRLTRSQDLEETYLDAGQFYIGAKSYWCATGPQAASLAMYVLPRWRAQDIDTLEDWTHAELLYRLQSEVRNPALGPIA